MKPKIDLRAIKESFRNYDESIVAYIRLIMTISGGTIALKNRADISLYYGKVGLTCLVITIIFGALCIHYLLMLKKLNNEQSVNHESLIREKEYWGERAMWAYKWMGIAFITGLFLIILV
ncbi:MAG: hypothetical protein HZA00_11380 [Nitrospinae bacterium]|nr:hypothetical protein [Nitrospinota bacterium]